jgi:DNA-binding NarL/FixJ family response regulator
MDAPICNNSAMETEPKSIRIVIADSEAIFRVGMGKIFALEKDLEVIAQTETLSHTLAVVAETETDIILFEAGLSPTPAEAVSEVLRRVLPGGNVVVVAQRFTEEETVDYLRRGVRGILTRSVSPDLLVRCVRKVSAGETWLDNRGVNWLIEAYRTQAQHGGGKQQLRLSEKEMLVISGVTQGLKNKDIALEVGTTEQVVKNYLRKIYDKLGVADRLELALYSMHRRLLDGYVPRTIPNGHRERRLAGTSHAMAANAGVSPGISQGDKEPTDENGTAEYPRSGAGRQHCRHNPHSTTVGNSLVQPLGDSTDAHRKIAGLPADALLLFPSDNHVAFARTSCACDVGRRTLQGR